MAKSIKLKNDTYLDNSSIFHGKCIDNLDTHYSIGVFTYNPNTKGKKPDDNEYGQLICYENSNMLQEGFSMITQIAVPTWSKKMYNRKKTNETEWSEWASITTTISKTINGISDPNGFIFSEIPLEATIVSCKVLSKPGICLPYTFEGGKYTFKCTNWNLESFGNQDLTIYVVYSP